MYFIMSLLVFSIHNTQGLWVGAVYPAGRAPTRHTEASTQQNELLLYKPSFYPVG